GLTPDEDVFGKGAKFAVPEMSVLGEHVSRKAHAIQTLVPILQDKLEQSGMHALFYELELPVASVLTAMEKQGVRVDPDELREYGEALSEKIDQYIAQIYELAGTEFNINSPKQLG